MLYVLRSVSVSNCMWSRNSIKIHPSHDFRSKKWKKIKYIYLQTLETQSSSSSRSSRVRLFQWCGYFIGHISGKAARVEIKTYHHMNNWQVWYKIYCRVTLRGKKRSSSRCFMLHWLHKFSLNTECDCADLQADPNYVTVTLGVFNAVNSKSCICGSLIHHSTQHKSTALLCHVRHVGSPLYNSV
jgi:hypothetical protein